MSQTYKRKLIRRLRTLLSKSKSPLLDYQIDLVVYDPGTETMSDFGGITIRDLLNYIVDTEL